MRWGHLEDVKGSEQLLYWVLLFAISPGYADLDRCLKFIMAYSGSLGGDPGWEMKHIPDADGDGYYHVYADPEMSGIESAEAIYSADEVRHAIRESLMALIEKYPERRDEAERLIRIYC